MDGSCVCAGGEWKLARQYELPSTGDHPEIGNKLKGRNFLSRHVQIFLRAPLKTQMHSGKGGCLQTNLRAYELQRISSERRVEKERAASLEFAFKEMFDLLEEENRHMSPLERHRFIGPGL